MLRVINSQRFIKNPNWGDDKPVPVPAPGIISGFTPKIVNPLKPTNIKHKTDTNANINMRISEEKIKKN